MKNLISSLIGTTAALAVAASIMAPNFSSADQIKGAQSLTKPVATSAPVAVASMNCGSCKTDSTSRIDTSARGAMKPAVLSSTHGCASCSTSVKTSGVGKAAVDVVNHTCAMGGNQTASCCN